jgi:hypothetical protein
MRDSVGLRNTIPGDSLWLAGKPRTGVFNILVRVLGLVSFFAGTVYIVWGTLRMLQMDFIQPEAASSLAILPVGLLVAILGASIIRAPTYRPDLGDVALRFDPFGTKTLQSSPSKRSWWTGDRL